MPVKPTNFKEDVEDVAALRDRPPNHSIQVGREPDAEFESELIGSLVLRRRAEFS